jgi:hypothetical protein
LDFSYRITSPQAGEGLLQAHFLSFFLEFFEKFRLRTFLDQPASRKGRLVHGVDRHECDEADHKDGQGNLARQHHLGAR